MPRPIQDELLGSLDRLAAAHQALAGRRDAVSKQAAAQIRRTTALVQLTLDHLALTNRDLAATLAEMGLLRQQQVEFLESQPSCVMTDVTGVIHEANTPGLLLLGASVRDVGKHSIDRFVQGADHVLAGLARGDTLLTAPVSLRAITPSREVTVRVRRAGRTAGLWHWLFA